MSRDVLPEFQGYLLARQLVPENVDVKEFLSYLAIKRRVSSSTQNQAFNALRDIFSYIK